MTPTLRHPTHTDSSLWPRRLAGASLIALILLSLAWELWLAPLRPGGSWLALKALPPCLLLPGILAGRRSTYPWASLLILLYLLEGLLRAVSDPGASRGWAAAEALVAATFFVSALFYQRTSRSPRLRAGD